MTDKELRRLSRADLVEIIYEVRQNEAALQEEVESLKKQLDEKQKKISKAGSLAELSASLNGLFESAQATADQYLQEISDIYEYAQKLKTDTERRAAAVANQALKERTELLRQTEEECRRMKKAAMDDRRKM